MTAAADPWRETADGVELAVRLTPRGGAPAIEGVTLADGRACLRVRVAAPPVDGAANAALIAYLAKRLRLPKSAFSLVAGERARVKRLRIGSADAAARLRELLAG